MPEAQAPRRPRRPRPEPAPRSPTYKASVALAVVFLGLALSLPLWLDRVRQPVDRSVLDRDLSSVQAIPGAGPQSLVLPPEPVTPPSGASATLTPGSWNDGSGKVNADCRAYVYARCNALKIGASDCLPIALAAMRVKVEEGAPACRQAVDARLREAAKEAGTDGEPAPSPDVLQAPDLPAQATGDAGRPATREEEAAAAAELAAAEAAKAAAKAAEAPALPPAQRAERLEKVLAVLEELQRGGNNYATLPAAQDARLAEIRALVESEGSPEAKAFFNRLVRRYQAPPPAEPGSVVADSPRQETGADPAPTTATEEMEQVRRMLNSARGEAGLPPRAAPDPADALRVLSPSEAPSAQEYRP